MADGYIQVPADSVGKKVATTEYTRPDGTVVERQQVLIGDRESRVEELLEQLILEIQSFKIMLLNALH
jgi:hypothetical protein